MTTSSSANHAIDVELRYFAAAAEAGRGLEMARIIGVSSYLVNALSTPADSLTPLEDGDRIDILPPFAGG